MVADWTIRPLSECMAAIIDYRGKTPRKTTTGVPLITAKVVKGGRIEQTDEFIALDDYDAWMRRGIPKAGDVVITTEAPLGEVAQLGGGQVALAQRLIALRGAPGVLDNDFLKFLMQSSGVQDQLHARASGTTVLGIKQSELRKVLLPLPPIEEQRRIGHILSTLDDKIELNRRMNETLEAMARALFKSWFVDFDPVRAKAEGRDTVIPKHLADLFPGSFEDSPRGEIPQGWEVRGLGECLALLKDGSHNPPQRVQAGIPFIAGATDIRNFSIDFAKCTYITDDDYRAIHRRWSVETGDVLLTIVGTVGNVALVAASDLPFSLQRSVAVLRPGPRLSSSFLYCLLHSAAFQTDVESRLNPTAQPGIYLGTLAAIPVCLPPQAVVVAFDAIASVLFAKMQTNIQACHTLTDLRDVLLRELMAGKLRLTDAEKVVRAV